MQRLVVLFTILVGALSPAGVQKKVTVVASGETHATLDACDCPTSPGGGFAKRASLISALRDSDDIVLVDAGGFSGGGLYDSYTRGRAGDSLRTLAALRAMGYMKYDAVCIGDDDLQFGTRWLASQAAAARVPLVSANCFLPDGRSLAAPYVIVRRGAYSLGITGVTTQERLVSRDDSVIVQQPVSAIRKIWKELRGKSDFQIILAHLGEELSRELLDTFPECGLVVNGHRKSSTEEFITPQGQVMLQFGFQGKALSFAEIGRDSKGLGITRNGWLDVGPEIPDDPVVENLITLPSQGEGSRTKTVFDLYIMSQCQFGCAALRDLVSIVTMFPAVEWHVWFIGTVSIDGSMSSLHGADELDDELLWLSVQAVYPGAWLEFLKARSFSESVKTEAVIRSLGLDLPRIKAWAARKGRAELALHYTRSMRMGINASPTLLINNASFSGEISKPRLAKLLCRSKEGASRYCDSIPECFSDQDCKKPGKTGACVSRKGTKAVCEYADAVRFTLTALVADSALSHPETSVLAGIADEFPGVVVDTVRVGSAKGKAFLADYDPSFLPFFIFDRAVIKTANYPSIEPALVPARDKFAFKKGMVKPSYFYKRTLEAPLFTLYADPVFPGTRDAIRIVLAAAKNNARIRVLPLDFGASDSVGAQAEESLRSEEALRWLVMLRKYPALFHRYLELFAERTTMSYWFTDCKKLGINVDQFVQLVEKSSSLLAEHRKDVEELGMKEPIEALVNNREVLAVKNQKELGEMLSKAAK